jgi:tRNA/rRNA methyltransferase
MDVYFILVGPLVPENIGASARAIKTMSFNKLRLVNPCDYLSKEAKMLAHGSVEILTSAQVFSSLDQALQDIDLVVGTSAKSRTVKHDVYPADRLVDIIRKKGSSVNSVGIVFGREEYGLSNEEVRQCDMLCTIPMALKYPSLNLSQAVMIIAYELSVLHTGITKKPVQKSGTVTLRAAQRKVEEVLSSIGVIQNRVLFNRIIERISMAGEDDLHLLFSVCKFFTESKKQSRTPGEGIL